MTRTLRNSRGVVRWATPLVFAGLAATILAATGTALAARSVAISTPCDPADCPFPRLSPAGAADLAAAGFSLTGYAALSTLLSGVYIAILVLLGVLVALRGAGAMRVLVGAIWLAMAFGSVSSFSPWPWAVYTVAPLGLVGFFWLLASFPTLTLAPRWIVIPTAAAGAWALITFGIPSVVGAIARQEPPWYQIVGPVFVTCVAAISVGQLVRWRRSSRVVRRSQAQLLIALGLMFVAGVIGAILAFSPERGGLGSLAGSLYSQLANFASAVVFLVFAAAMLRDGVHGVRVAVDNVLFGAVAVVATLAIYVATVVIASQLVLANVAAGIAAVVSALGLVAVFQPLRRGIDRLVYGDRDAATVVGALTMRIATAASAAEVLPDVLDELRHRMHWPAVEFRSAEMRWTRGRDSDRRASIDLAHLGGPVGTVTVSLRAGQRRASGRDRAILAATAGAFATAVSVIRLTEAADDARREIVTTRERERADLRRRLHDGVGPSLAVARHLVQAVRGDLAAAAAEQRQLAAAETALSDSVAQIRSLSRELRPPALDEIGFDGAIRLFASDLGVVAVVTGDAVDDLPDEHRVALYRIAAESTVNAQRHGAAHTVAIDVRRDGRTLTMSVADDGTGIAPGAPVGVGFESMRERAAQLEGEIVVSRREPHGTRVDVRLLAPSAGAR